MDEPTQLERQYLRSLIDRTRTGPRLPIGSMTGAGVRAWIEALEPIATAMDALEELPSLRRYVVQRVSSCREGTCEHLALSHEHSIDTYTTKDDIEVVYCTTCGAEW